MKEDMTKLGLKLLGISDILLVTSSSFHYLGEAC